jgi:dihydrofolate synthase/folylpolyglutamate synthase
MSDTLSYFEYTTLLALVVFEQCGLMILEAGLGGEYDATNVCDKELSVISPIGIDHQAFLGDSIEAIAQTKIRSIQKRALIAPQPYAEVIEVAKKIAGEKKAVLYWSVQGSGLGIQSSGRMLHLTQTESEYLGRVVRSKGWPAYLRENAVVALQALGLLEIPYEIDNLMTLELFGRFYPLAENIRIDVGHNPLAARAITAALKEPVVLIYNSLDDKDYEAVLRILKPEVKRVEIIPIDSQRAATVDAIRTALERIGLPYSDFNGVIDREEHYLVFGSFYTVEAFIKMMKKGSYVSE